MPDNEKANAYVSWITFKNAIDGFGQGLPNRIDRSVFPGLAGGVQYQLLAALRFFRLIEEDGKPTAALRGLAVPEEAERKKQLAALFRERYPFLFALDLTKTTPAELDEKMTEGTGLTGSTRKKAVRFFLAGAKYLSVPVSPLLDKRQPTNGGGAPRKTRTRRPSRAVVTEPQAPSGGSSGASKVISLNSGGTLTVSASLDLFSLSPADRKFLNELIEKLESYEMVTPSGQSQTNAGREE